MDALEKTQGERRVMFFTDGVVTAGEQDSGRLKTRIGALSKRGVQRVDAIVDTTADTSRLNLSTDSG